MVIGGGVGDDEVKIKLAFEALADDVHVKETEEADAEAKTEDGAVFRLEAEGGVGEGETFDGFFKVFVLVVRDGEKAGVDKGENVFVAGEGRSGWGFGEGDGVADFGVASGLEVGDDVADFAGSEGGFGLHVGGEDADLEGDAFFVGGEHFYSGIFVKVAFENADVEDDAAVIVEIRIEDEGAGGGLADCYVGIV